MRCVWRRNRNRFYKGSYKFARKFEGRCKGCGKVFYFNCSEFRHVGDPEPVGSDGTNWREVEIQRIKDRAGENRASYFNYGWICPKCGSVMSPDQKTCLYCSPAVDIKVTY